MEIRARTWHRGLVAGGLLEVIALTPRVNVRRLNRAQHRIAPSLEPRSREDVLLGGKRD